MGWDSGMSGYSKQNIILMTAHSGVICLPDSMPMFSATLPDR